VSLGYLFLILALLSAAGLGVCHKLADLKRCKPSAINVMLFGSASILFWGYLVGVSITGSQGSLLPLLPMRAVFAAVACGVCACFGILTFQNGVRYGRIATSWLIVNLSTFVPSVLSLVIYQEWKEQFRWQQPAALALVIVSMFLLWRDKVAEIQNQECQEG